MKIINKSIWFLVFLFVLSVISPISAANPPPLTKKHKLSVLFIQHAKTLSMQALGKHCYRLTLSGARKKVLYFTNRPNRIVGHMTTQQFLTLWHRNKIRPNTLVDGFIKPNDTNESSSAVLTFDRMHYESATGDVVYKACLTDPKKQHALSIKTLYDVTLFFDNFVMWSSS